jgi:hypothetical protein
MGYNVKRIPHIVGCSGCFEWWVFFIKVLKISWLAATAKSLALALSFFLSLSLVAS